jgi:CRISPR-associated protein Cmr1
MSGSTYLGWGIVASGRQANSPRHRIGWNEGAIFKLTLTFKPGTSASDQDEVLEALKAWSLLGGLGARSRRGFGSVALRKLQGENQMSDSEDAYRQKVRVLLQASASAPLAPYTALGCATRWAVVTVRPTAREAHEAIGVMYRQTVNSFDRSLRAAFGLPRPGQQSSLRRGSPLFLHVHPVGDHYVGAACWIPSDPFNPPRSVTREDLEHVADAFRFNWMTGGEK